jgi:hypothetical protein
VEGYGECRNGSSCSIKCWEVLKWLHSSPSSPPTDAPSLDRTTFSPTLSLASNPSLLYHHTTRWPHRRPLTTNCEHFWHQTPPHGSRSNKFPASQSLSTATRLPESLDRTFQPPYFSRCSSVSTVCRTRAPEQRRSWSQAQVTANDTIIFTYRCLPLSVRLGLRMDFTWRFVVADVIQPVMGADFLAHLETTACWTASRRGQELWGMYRCRYAKRQLH